METDADDEVPKKRRIKAKRMVTKTYEDEDGFISKPNGLSYRIL